jgi:hypothetical protein
LVEAFGLVVVGAGIGMDLEAVLAFEVDFEFEAVVVDYEAGIEVVVLGLEAFGLVLHWLY